MGNGPTICAATITYLLRPKKEHNANHQNAADSPAASSRIFAFETKTTLSEWAQYRHHLRRSRNLDALRRAADVSASLTGCCAERRLPACAEAPETWGGRRLLWSLRRLGQVEKTAIAK